RQQQGVEHHGIAEQRVQAGIGGDAALAPREVRYPPPGPSVGRLFLRSPDGGEAEGRQQQAGGVREHGDDRTEEPDRRATEGRTDGGGGPVVDSNLLLATSRSPGGTSCRR